MGRFIKFQEYCKLDESQTTEPGDYFLQLGNNLMDSEVISPYGMWNCIEYVEGEQLLVWTLNYPEQPMPGVELKFKNNSISYYFFDSKTNGKALAAGSFPFHYSLDIEKDTATIIEFFDSIVQWFENPEKYPCFAKLEKNEEQQHKASPPQQVPLKQVFKTNKEPEDLEPGWDKDLPEVHDKLPKKTWRDAVDENEIVKLFPFRPKTDEVLDLWKKAKELRSNKLMNLAKQASSRTRE